METHASFEERLGTSWLNKLGVVILVLGIASFLAYQLTDLGPVGKVTTGATLAVIMVVAGARLERSERYRLLARALIGGGWGLLYFVAFATYFVPAARVIDSQPVAFTLMLGVAAAMVAHTLRYESQALTLLGFLVAFATITLHHNSVLSLAAGAILAMALLAIVRARQWYALELAGILATFLNHLLWLQPAIADSRAHLTPFTEYPLSTALLVFYWLAFRTSFVLAAPATDADERLTSGSAVLTTGLFLALLRVQAPDLDWAFQCLLAVGLLELGFAWLPFIRRRRLAFVTLTTVGASLVVAAMPFRFGGGTLDLVWLAEAEALILAGVFGGERLFRRVGLLAGAVLVVRLLSEGLAAFDSGDREVVVSLLSTAVVLYLNAGWLRRRGAATRDDPFAGFVLRAGSFIASGLVVLTATVVSQTWTATGWVAAAFLLAVVSRMSDDADLALQAVGLGVLGTGVALTLNSTFDAPSAVMPMVTTRLATTAPIVVLQCLMAGVLGRRPSYGVPAAAVFAGAASLLAMLLIGLDVPAIHVATAWALFGVVLLEVAMASNVRLARWQAGLAFVAAFIRLYTGNLNGAAECFSPTVATVAPSIAAFYYAHQRLARSAAGLSEVAAWAGTIMVAGLVLQRVDAAAVAPVWAAIVCGLVAAAWISRRGVFADQAALVGIAVCMRAMAFNLSELTTTTPFWQGRTGSTSVTAAGLSAALAMALAARRRGSLPAGRISAATLVPLEHALFFATAMLVTVMLAAVTPHGLITVSWGVEGVAIFLLALLVGERSYRLTGLALLLLCVAKIGLVDVWELGPQDRWITLTGLGGALMLVSFLYSRYRELIRRYL